MGSNRSRRMLHRMNREEGERLRELAELADQPAVAEDASEPVLSVNAGLAQASAVTGPDQGNED